MLFRLFLLFTIAPAIELAILIYAGSLIGTLNTLAIVILTALAGSILVRREGIEVMNRFRSNLQSGIFPSEEIMDGALVLVAGTLLLTPGFVTDILGLLLVVPTGREIIKPFIRNYIKRKFLVVHQGGSPWP